MWRRLKRFISFCSDQLNSEQCKMESVFQTSFFAEGQLPTPALHGRGLFLSDASCLHLELPQKNLEEVENIYYQSMTWSFPVAVIDPELEICCCHLPEITFDARRRTSSICLISKSTFAQSWTKVTLRLGTRCSEPFGVSFLNLLLNSINLKELLMSIF